MSASDERGDPRADVPPGAGPALPNSAAPAPASPLDIREEWDPDTEQRVARGDVPLDGVAPVGTVREGRAARVDTLPKKRVRGIARGVDTRIDQNNNEKLSFRVDRYDAGGNRLTPVPVELRHHRGGLVTDGDEVEVVGRWSRGTLRASRIVNLSTASEVRTWVPRGLKWVALVLMIVVALVGGILLVGGVLSKTAGATVNIPTIAGQNELAALSTLHSRGLSGQSITEPSDTIPRSQVIRTDPPAGFSVAKGSAVTVVVSSGPATPATAPSALTPPPPPPQSSSPSNRVPKVTPTTTPKPSTPSTRYEQVPDTRARSQAQATQQLEGLGFFVTVVGQASYDVPNGYVIRSDPPPGAMAAAASPVRLYVSTGPPSATSGF